MGPGDLSELLRLLACAVPPSAHPDLLVPAEQGADASVFRVAPDVAIVQSADFFPPMVDDPATFGRISAANALSDIYACGARPVTAINLLAAPKNEPRERLVAMLAAAAEVVAESGAVMAGGHTLLDDSVKFGLSVTGVVHPDKLVRHNTPQIGDALVLTKPLGSGALITAYGRGLASEDELADGLRWMTMLNRRASELLGTYNASASTDITGYGLIGHALDMISGGYAGIELSYAALPLMGRAEEWIVAGAICGGTRRNLEFYGERVDYRAANETQRALLNDSQTSGGLLIALPIESAAQFAAEAGAGAAVIGRVVADHPATITVV